MSAVKLTFPRGALCNYPLPADLGLEHVGELELDNESYSFNLIGVWRDKEGRLWWGTDSGCSCPSPWEDHEELDRLFNFDPLAELIVPSSATPSDSKAFEATVRQALADLAVRS